MSDYRFKFVQADGQVIASGHLEFDDDLGALDHATALLSAFAIEGWQGERLVFTVRPDGACDL